MSNQNLEQFTNCDKIGYSAQKSHYIWQLELYYMPEKLCLYQMFKNF